jgi:hypothetical protein
MKERGLLLVAESRRDHCTIRKTAEGQRRNVWGLRVDTLLCEKADQPDQTDQCTVTPSWKPGITPPDEDAVGVGETSSQTSKGLIDLDS